MMSVPFCFLFRNATYRRRINEVKYAVPCDNLARTHHGQTFSLQSLDDAGDGSESDDS